MTSVTRPRPPKRRKSYNRGSGSLGRSFLLEKVGEVSQLPGTGGVCRLKSMFVFVVIFKHQLVELPPYPQLAVSLSPYWEKNRAQYSLGLVGVCSVFL